MPNEYNLSARPERERWIPTTKYKYFEGDRNSEEPKGLNGEDYYHRFLTIREQNFGCKCDQPQPKRFTLLDIENVNKFPLGIYCGSCLLPRWDFIHSVYQICQGCNKSFAILALASNFVPKKADLCSTCLAKVPVSKRVRRIAFVKIG